MGGDERFTKMVRDGFKFTKSKTIRSEVATQFPSEKARSCIQKMVQAIMLIKKLKADSLTAYQDRNFGPPLNLINQETIDELNCQFDDVPDKVASMSMIRPSVRQVLQGQSPGEPGIPWDKHSVRQLANQNMYEFGRFNPPENNISLKKGIVYTQMGKDGETEIKLVGRQPFRETSTLSLSEYAQLK